MYLEDEQPAPRRRHTATLGMPTLRIVTFAADLAAEPAPRAVTSYRDVVAGLAANVAELPASSLAALPTALPALRAALVDARWLVGAEPTSLAAALAELGRILDLLSDGALPPPSRLGQALGAVVSEIQAAPASRSLALSYALRHLVGVIGATCGQLLGAARLAAVAPPAPVVVDAAAEVLADQRFADGLIIATTLFGAAVCGGMALVEAPEAAIAAAAVTLALATGWSVYRGRRQN